jgi:hypothetical protein
MAESNGAYIPEFHLHSRVRVADSSLFSAKTKYPFLEDAGIAQ